MGAIQQAFNQALSVMAIAAGPQIAEKKAIRKAETAATKAEDYRLSLAEKEPKVEDAILDEALQRSYEAYSKSYAAKPTKGKLEYLGTLRGEKEEIIAQEKADEKAAKRAAEKLMKEREKYRDQLDMLHSIAEGVRWGSTQQDKGGAK